MLLQQAVPFFLTLADYYRSLYSTASRVLTDASTQESFPSQLRRLSMKCCANFDLLCTSTGLSVDVGIKFLPGTDAHVAMLEVSSSRCKE